MVSIRLQMIYLTIRCTYDIRAQVIIPTASRNHIDRNRVASTNQRTTRNRARIHLSASPIRSPRHTPTINRGRRRRRRARVAVNSSLGPGPRIRQRRSDAQSRRVADRAGQSERDLLAVIHVLKNGHRPRRRGCGRHAARSPG